MNKKLKFKNDIKNNFKCPYGAIDSDGIPKDLKSTTIKKQELYFGFDNIDLLCVIHDFKPVATYYDSYDKLRFIDEDENYLPSHIKNKYIKELALSSGLVGIPYIKDEHSSVYIAFKPKNIDIAVYLTILWMLKGKSSYSSELTSKILSLKEHFILNKKQIKHINTLSEFSSSYYDILNGFLLGYPKDEIKGYVLRDYLNRKMHDDKYFAQDPDDKTWLKAFNTYRKGMTDNEIKMFDKGFDNLWNYMKTQIRKNISSKSFKQILKTMEKYVSNKMFISK